MDLLTFKFIALLATSSLRYFIFAGIPFILFYGIYSSYFKANKIQASKHKKIILLGEIKHSLLTILIIASFSALVLFTPFRQYTLIYEQLHDFPWWWMPLSIVLALIIHDTYFYFLHRIIHHKKVYRYVHRIHHISTNPSPWTSYSFDVLEAILENLILIILVLVLPMHMLALISFGLLSFIINVYGHLGYEIMPKWFRKSFLFEVINTSVYHNLHHKEFKGNYGLYFRWWDRFFGTEHPNYVATYDAIQHQRFADKPKKNTTKTWLTFALLAIFIVLSSFATTPSKPDISGEWLSEGEYGKAYVRMYEADNGKIYATYIQALDPKQHLEVQTKLKEAGKQKLYLLKDFDYVGQNKWSNGTFYSPKRNEHFSGHINLTKSGKLKVTGYYMGFSKSYFWTRKTK